MADADSTKNTFTSAFSDDPTVPIYSVKATIDTTFKADVIHVYLLGMSIILGGFTGAWNEGFEAGLWSYFIGLCNMSVGYTMLASCLAELTSTVTFAGGAYGYVRSTLGPYFGFMTGCFELLMYNFYTICAVQSLGTCVTTIGVDEKWEPLTFFWFYCGIVVFHLRGGVYFWAAMCIFAVISILTILLYCLAVLSQGEHFWNHSLADNRHDSFSGGSRMFFDSLHESAWFFVGIETISVAGGRIQEATNVVPKAILWCFGSVLVLAFLVFFATVLQYQDRDFHSLPQVFSPMSLGWHESLGIDRHLANFMTFPSNFASALGFMYGSMHLLQSMSLSGLMPEFFQASVGDSKVSVRSLLTCTLLQFSLLVLVNHFSDNHSFYDIAIIGATFVNIGLLASYLIFYYKFSIMERNFRSPFGPIGAYIGIFIFFVVFLSLVGTLLGNVLVFIFFAISITAYYYTYVESRQYFSEEEQKHFMRAYIVNANARRKMTPFQRFVTAVIQQLFGCCSCCCCCQSIPSSVIHPV